MFQIESAQHDSALNVRWMADNMWLMVPAQEFVQKFLATIPDYPFQSGSSLSAGSIGYGTLEMQKAKGSLKRLLDMSVHN